MNLILASASPRRKELLQNAGYTFEVHPAIDEEIFDENGTLEAALKKVASHKAHEVFDLYPECCVLAADTIVWFAGKRLGKPKDISEAKTFLSSLSGNAHEVKTGVSVLFDHHEIAFVETTEVHFRDLSNIEIDNYIKMGTCMDKAGVYGIQECDFVDWIDGSFSNVVGLPMEHVQTILDKLL